MRIAIGMLAAFLAMTSLPLKAFAAPSARSQPQGCEQTAATTYELNMCASSRAAEADRRLNKAYREIMRYLEPKEQAQLIAAQKAWLAFRDSDCAFFSSDGGSLSPMNNAFCRAGLSQARAKELENWPPNASRDALVPFR